MGLKRRLVVAFLILLIVPVLLIGVAGAAVMSRQHGIVESGHVDVEDNKVMYYVVRDNESAAPRLQMPLVQTAILLGLTILMTAVVLVSWLYSSLIKPLNVLRMATANMKAGNLDFAISGDPEDELGQLCEEFEEMRVRLKEQVDARMRYEQDTVELISNISHDLKTPLTAIKGYAEGMLDGVADTEEKKQKYLRTIYTKASDMTALVDELSFYSKIDSNIVPYNFDRINVNAYFSDCVEDLGLDMEVKGVTLDYYTQVPVGMCMVADPEQLRRVVNNITGNAVKYMGKPEGHIDINVSVVDEAFVKIDIADNGVGIAQNDLEHIFERFYRADSSRGTKKGGTGLGLAIAKKIIEDHGGTISATSTFGEGTCFTFTVPVYTEKPIQCDDVEDAEYSAVLNAQGARMKRSKNG